MVILIYAQLDHSIIRGSEGEGGDIFMTGESGYRVLLKHDILLISFLEFIVKRFFGGMSSCAKRRHTNAYYLD